MTGTLRAICISPAKGTAKHAVPRAELVINHGLAGDAHAGPWHRQVSLLDQSDIDTMLARGLDLEPGAFGENLIVTGLDLATVGAGSRLRVGDALLEVTQIGKQCHDHCAIYDAVGTCIMPKRGLFTRVLHGADIAPGAVVSVEHLNPRTAGDLQHLEPGAES